MDGAGGKPDVTDVDVSVGGAVPIKLKNKLLSIFHSVT